MKYIKVGKFESIISNVIGWIFFPILFPFAYVRFWERERYVNLKNLISVMEETFDKLDWVKMEFTPGKVTYESEFGDGKLYKWWFDTISWHEKGMGELVTDFSPDCDSKKLVKKLNELVSSSIELAESNGRLITI